MNSIYRILDHCELARQCQIQVKHHELNQSISITYWNLCFDMVMADAGR